MECACWALGALWECMQWSLAEVYYMVYKGATHILYTPYRGPVGPSGGDYRQIVKKCITYFMIMMRNTCTLIHHQTILIIYIYVTRAKSPKLHTLLISNKQFWARKHVFTHTEFVWTVWVSQEYLFLHFLEISLTWGGRGGHPFYFHSFNII